MGLCGLFVSCKPSEKNYRAAYEVARDKEREGLEEDIYEKMMEESRPKLVVIGTDSLYVAPKESLLIFWQPGSENKSVTTAPPFNLVIGEYTNPANARAHAAQFMPQIPQEGKKKKSEPVVADTIPAGWDWYPMVLVKGAENHYYVAIAHGDSIEDLVPAQRLFKEKGLRTVVTDRPIVRTRR